MTVPIAWPLRVGIVGTGYAAKARAEALLNDGRSRLVAICGRDLARTQEVCQPYGAIALTDWMELVNHADIDLVIVATVNQDHGAIARAALQAGKHVVVEYPLSLHLMEAEELITLAQAQHRLLHVEHIELLSGIHGAIAQALPQIGTPFYVRYSSVTPQHPAPDKWTYQPERFGFPLIGALSRIHRLTNLFGTVKTVTCQTRYWDRTDRPSFYATCICTAQLRFTSGLIADLSYGKGEALWQAERDLLIQGATGAIVINGEQGTLIQENGSSPMEMGSRRGLFARDTALLLDHLQSGTPLYVTPADSLYALQVADAARRSSETGQAIALDLPQPPHL